MKKRWFSENTVFVWTLTIAICIIVFGVVYSSTLDELSATLMRWVSTNFGWFYILSVVAFIGFCLWISLSKFGKIRLGKDNEKPEFSTFSWYAMLFCGSTGIGLVFWSIAEPLSHYAAPPVGIEAGTKEAIDFSIRTCYLHWGITQWVCFAVVGLGVAYFQFRKGKNAQLSNLLTPLVGERLTNGWFGKLIDGFAVVVSFSGVATSLGLGVSQICGGLNHQFGVPQTEDTILSIIILITLVFIVSAISGVYKGIKILSNLNTYLAIALLVLAFVVGPKITILNNLTNSVGQHIQYFFKDVFMINAFGDNDWVMNWRVFYFAWFVAWTPFVAMFLARISKGRTIREFITGVVVVPTVFTILWLSVFSAIALTSVQGWSVEAVSALIASPETAVFIVFEHYPLSNVISIMIIVLLGVFFITSADSATYSLSVMTSNGNINPPYYKEIVWGVVESYLAYVLLSAGSLKPIQTISIAATLPFLIVMIAMMPALVKDMRVSLFESREKNRVKDNMNYRDHLHIVFCQDHYNPLGVIRSLGEEGIKPVVILVCEGKPYLVNKSKYIGKLYLTKSIEQGYKFLIEQYSSQEIKPFIYTCSDDIESYLDMHYDELQPHFYFFNGGEQGQITRTMEKNEMMRLAVECGIDIPRTEVVKVGELPKTLRYPILTKSVISTMANWKSNVHICHDEGELKKAYKLIRGEQIILQEYIEKKNELCIDGIALSGQGIFIPVQSEYIRFTPDAYGNYILFQEFKEQRLLEKMQALFEKTRFTGIFSIEFLRDKDESNFYFLEINFRNSTWSYAHTVEGVNLPVIWAKSVLAGHLVTNDVVLKKKRFVAMQEFTDFKDSVIGHQCSLWQWIKDVRNCDCLFYYNKSDKKPFWSILKKKLLRF